MSNNLFQAHREWRDRPADERYSTLASVEAAVAARAEASVASKIDPTKVRAVVQSVAGMQGAQLVLEGEKGGAAVPSNWALSQLCSYSDVPAQWLRKIPAELAATNLNWGLQHSPRTELEMLWAPEPHSAGTVRCFNTPSYTRLWDMTVVQWVRRATNDETGGWHRPPAKTDAQYPSGYYVGDRNIFLFLVNDQNRIEDGKQGLGRGFFVWNSEVHQMSFGFEAFLYEYVCGNHIVWGAQRLFSFRMSHLGADMVEKAAEKLRKALGLYLNASATGEQRVIDAARKQVVAPNEEGAREFLSGRKVGFNVRDSALIVERAVQDGDDPTILWSLVNAGTALSQTRFKHQDTRNQFDKRASRLLDYVAF